MCPDSHRRFPVCYRRDADQENEDVASDENGSLVRSEKETERQQDLNRQNQNINICDQGVAPNVNIARTNDDIDYIYSNYWAIQPYGIIVIVTNDSGEPITVYFGLVTKKSKLSNNDTFVAIKSQKWPSKALTQWFGNGYNYETIRRSKTTLPEAVLPISHLKNLNTSPVAGKTESQSKQSNASHSTASQRSLKELKSPLDGEKQSIYPDWIPMGNKEKNKLINDEMLYRPINKDLLLDLFLEFDLRNDTTRRSKTTIAETVISLNFLNKLAVAGKTESQSKQSNASHSTASQRSLKELKSLLDGKRDFNMKQASTENLDSEPVVTDEPSDIDDSPILVSTDKDEATSDGEESTDSDYEFEMMKLFAWLDKKDWARSYYDCDDGVVIHVEPGHVEESKRLLSEEFPDFHKYKVVETDPGTCKYSADPFEEDEEQPNETNNSQTPNGQNPAPTINTGTQSAEVSLSLESAEEQLDTQTAKTQSLEAEMGSQATGGYDSGGSRLSELGGLKVAFAPPSPRSIS